MRSITAIFNSTKYLSRVQESAKVA